MPHLDHTGPKNKGPKTGRKLGLCHKTKIELTKIGELGRGEGKRRHSNEGTGKGRRLKYNQSIIHKKRVRKMKIAVPVSSNNQIDGHFGHCEFYSVFNVSPEGKIADTKIIPSLQGCGCKSNIAGVLAADGVTVMLAGGIGGGAINVLNNAGIEVIRGCSGDASEVVNLYIAGSVADSGESCHTHKAHHSEGSGRQCSH